MIGICNLSDLINLATSPRNPKISPRNPKQIRNQCRHKSNFGVNFFPLDTKVNHPFQILQRFQFKMFSTSIQFSKVLNLFYSHVPPCNMFWWVGIIFDKWNMQMTERGNTKQFKHGNMKQMKHANAKKGKYWAMAILNIWTKLGPGLIIFKHGNMCQPHHGTQPPLCRPHTIPHQKHLLQIWRCSKVEKVR